MLLGVWLANLVTPLLNYFTRKLGGRARAAAAVTWLALVAVLLPVVGMGATVLSFLATTLPRLKSAVMSGSMHHLLQAGAAADHYSWASLVKEHAAGLWNTLLVVSSASADVLINAFVILVTLYGVMVSGDFGRRYLERNLQLPNDMLPRLIAAFHETGRGLILGAGLTALAQAAIASIAYMALGISQALVLGLVTGIASFLPVVGTGLVWAPLAAGLALDGHPIRAVILVVIGLGVIGLVDNALRPALSRFGQLELSYPVLLLSMACGAAAFGMWGLLYGPLIVRLAIEAFRQSPEDAGERVSRVPGGERVSKASGELDSRVP